MPQMNQEEFSYYEAIETAVKTAAVTVSIIELILSFSLDKAIK